MLNLSICIYFTSLALSMCFNTVHRYKLKTAVMLLITRFWSVMKIIFIFEKINTSIFLKKTYSTQD